MGGHTGFDVEFGSRKADGPAQTHVCAGLFALLAYFIPPSGSSAPVGGQECSLTQEPLALLDQLREVVIL